MDRRSMLALGAGTTLAMAASNGASAQTGSRKPFVLVHGAWHGGWCWQAVAAQLRGAGHLVHTPTQTGLGQYRHVLSREITLDTFVADIANLFEMEDLSDAVLVGHSFAGSVISGVADRMPERIAHLVYLDSMIVESGQSPFGSLPAEVAAARRKLVADQGLGIALPSPPVTAFGIPQDHPQAAWVARRLTPHPVGTYESALHLDHSIGNGRPCTYIHCTQPSYAALEGSRQLARKQPGWQWLEIATGHDAMVLAPDVLSRMLLGFA